MVVPHSYLIALSMTILTMACWGSWANVVKLVKDWRFELLYYDYSLGILLTSIVAGLARPYAPSLSAARISADGALQGLELSPDENESQFEIEKNRPGDGGILLIARLLGLLCLFLGEALTLSLLRNAWPGEVFDDGNTAHGRKA